MARTHGVLLRRFPVCLALLCLILGPQVPVAIYAQDELPQLKIKVGEKAPDFSLPASDGNTVKLSDLTGHNVLIDFYRGYW